MPKTPWSFLFLNIVLTLCALASISVVWILPRLHEEALKPRRSPPRYPKAEQVEQRTDLFNASFPKGIISFTTTDSPETVQSFYHDFLTRVGWDFGDYPFEDVPETSYFQYWPDDGPVYKVMIKAKDADLNTTTVVITMTSNYHNWYGEFWK